MECPECKKAELEPEAIEEDDNHYLRCPNCRHRFNGDGIRVVRMVGFKVKRR